MAEKGTAKVTWIQLETESLKSEKNLKKIRKALYIFSQIRDQAYDEENNTVTIKVICCSPEKLMDKLCSKGRGAIKRMKIIEKPKPESKSESKPGSKPEYKIESESEPKPKPEPKSKPEETQTSKEPEKSEPVESKPTPAETGTSSQPVTVQLGYPIPMGMYNGPSYGLAQPNWYPERPVYDSYGGGPPPSQFYVQEESSFCRIC